MTPTSPVLPTGWGKSHELVIAKDQPQYIPLPALPVGDGILTRWRLSWRERWRILRRGDLYLEVLTFGRPLQPLRPTVLPPILAWNTDIAVEPCTAGANCLLKTDQNLHIVTRITIVHASKEEAT